MVLIRKRLGNKKKASPRMTSREARGLKRESGQQTWSSEARDFKRESFLPITKPSERLRKKVWSTNCLERSDRLRK